MIHPGVHKTSVRLPGLTLFQPEAELIMSGRHRFCERHWSAARVPFFLKRKDLALHVAKVRTKLILSLCQEAGLFPSQLHFGAVIGILRVGSVYFSRNPDSAILTFEKGVRLLRPLEYRGQQHVYAVDIPKELIPQKRSP